MRHHDVQREHVQFCQIYHPPPQMRDPSSKAWRERQARLRLCHLILQLNNFAPILAYKSSTPRELTLLKSTGKSSDTTDLNSLHSISTSASLLIPRMPNSYSSLSFNRKLRYTLNKQKTYPCRHCGPHSPNTYVAPQLALRPH